MHLHGHGLWILAQGTGTYEAGAVELQLVDAPRRNTVQILGHGHVVIAFKADNPGVKFSYSTDLLGYSGVRMLLAIDRRLG